LLYRTSLRQNLHLMTFSYSLAMSTSYHPAHASHSIIRTSRTAPPMAAAHSRPQPSGSSSFGSGPSQPASVVAMWGLLKHRQHDAEHLVAQRLGHVLVRHAVQHIERPHHPPVGDDARRVQQLPKVAHVEPAA